MCAYALPVVIVAAHKGLPFKGRDIAPDPDRGFHIAITAVVAAGVAVLQLTQALYFLKRNSGIGNGRKVHQFREPDFIFGIKDRKRLLKVPVRQEKREGTPRYRCNGSLSPA